MIVAALTLATRAGAEDGIAAFKKGDKDPNGMTAKTFFEKVDGALGCDFNSLILVFGGCFTSDFSKTAEKSAVGKCGKPVAVLAATDKDKPEQMSAGDQLGGAFAQGVTNNFDKANSLDGEPGTVEQAFEGGKNGTERLERKYIQGGEEPPVRGQKPTLTTLGKEAKAVRPGRGASSYHAILFVGRPTKPADWKDLVNTYDMLVANGYDPKNISALFGNGERAQDTSPTLLGENGEPGQSVTEAAGKTGAPNPPIKIEPATHDNLKKKLEGLKEIAKKSKDEQYFIWAADHSTHLAMAEPQRFSLPPGQAYASAEIPLDQGFLDLVHQTSTPQLAFTATGCGAAEVALNDAAIGSLSAARDGSAQGLDLDPALLRPGRNLVRVAGPGGCAIVDLGLTTGPFPIATITENPVVTPTPPPPAKTTSMLVGVVLPDETRRGERFTATVVPDPETYRSTPGLRVVTTRVRVPLDSAGQPTLDGVTVRVGGGPARSARQPFVSYAPTSGPFDVAIGAPWWPSVSVPLDFPTEEVAPAPLPTPTYMPRPEGSSPFETPPVCIAGGPQVIRGPFDGDWSTTFLELGGQPAPIVAESMRTMFWRVPDGTRAGSSPLVCRDAGVGASFPVSVLQLVMGADRLTLKRGESTRFFARVLGLDSLPEGAWRAGVCPDLVDLAGIRRLTPGFTPPPPGGAGVVVLSIENLSTDVISIGGARGEFVVETIDRATASRGPFEYRGSIHSKKTGGFNVRGTVVPFLSPVAGTPLEPPQLPPPLVPTPAAE